MDRLAVLHAFVRLVELQTFTGVAEELRVKQSTVSKWVAALEEELGVRLVERNTRALRITEAGARFAVRARGVLTAYAEAASEARAQHAELRGRARLSLPVVFGRQFVLPTLMSLLQEEPGLELELVFDDTYVRLVEAGFDMAIRVGVALDSTLVGHVLGRSPRWVVGTPAYLDTHGRPQHPDELLAHQCVVHDRLNASWRFGARASVPVQARVSTNHSEAARQLALNGLGLARLASWMVAEDVAEGRLEVVLTEHPSESAHIHALTPPGGFVPPHVAAIIQRLQEELPARLSKGLPP